jgi:hypothetical protein
MWTALLRGAIAGAAGTTALNALTYADMALRGRAPSDLPEQAVAQTSEQHGVPIPGEGQQREHRLQGLGALGGIGVGVALGVAAGLVRPLLIRMPLLVSGTLVGAGAMAATDLPMAGKGLTDPKQWSTAEWASDVVPHLAYGIVTVGALRRFSQAA